MAPTLKTPKTPSTPDAEDPTAAIGAGQKPVGAEPEPLVGTEDADVQVEVDALLKRLEELNHGRRAEAEAAVEVAEEAKAGDTADAEASAEAVDQGQVPTADVVQAEEVAADKAADLAAIESEVGPDAFELAVTAAGDRADHVRAVTVAARAAKAALDSGDGHVARARAFQAVEDLAAVESPHGRVAEEHDPWAGERWAPHGDQNVPAGSDALSAKAAEQERGLNPEADNEHVDEFRDGVDIAKERKAENAEARKIGKATVVDYSKPARPRRLAKPDPDASEPQV